MKMAIKRKPDGLKYIKKVILDKTSKYDQTSGTILAFYSSFLFVINSGMSLQQCDFVISKKRM
ncbi:hypothetical protein Hanom_Chr16g01433661 [Helianthus anomalus]